MTFKMFVLSCGLLLIFGRATASQQLYGFEAKWTAPNLVWVRDSAVNVTIGPDDALYCKLEDPAGVVETSGFGPCQLTIPRVKESHQGTWKISLYQPGQIVLTEENFLVTVTSSGNQKPVITKNFYKEGDTTFVVTCGIASPSPVKMCKFRDPSGKVYVSSQNLKIDRFETFIQPSSAESPEHTCGLKISSIQVSDMGLWRCAIDTEEASYYAFQAVQCGKMMQDPEIAAQVVLKPIPKSPRSSIMAIAGDEVTMSCFVPAVVRYCFFRKNNGTIYNVAPGFSSSEGVEYVGSGLNAGECGIKFKAQMVDNGAWSCHFGYFNMEKQEKNLQLQLTIEDQMVTYQYMSGSELVVEAKVHNSRPLDFCAFIRMDGYGMTSDRTWLPSGYESRSNPTTGHCALHVSNPGMLDHHPWTVVAKYKDQEAQVVRLTPHSFHVVAIGGGETGREIGAWTWFLVSIAILSVIVGGLLFIPKRNRHWTILKMSSLRHSFRKSETVHITEKHLPEYYIAELEKSEKNAIGA